MVRAADDPQRPLGVLDDDAAREALRPGVLSLCQALVTGGRTPDEACDLVVETVEEVRSHAGAG